MLHVELDHIFSEEDAGKRLPDLLNIAEYQKELVVITRNNRPAVVMIDIERIENLTGKNVTPVAPRESSIPSPETPSPIAGFAAVAPTDFLQEQPQLPQDIPAMTTPEPAALPDLPDLPDMPDLPDLPEIPQSTELPTLPEMPPIPEAPSATSVFQVDELNKPTPARAENPSTTQPVTSAPQPLAFERTPSQYQNADSSLPPEDLENSSPLG